MFRQLFVLSRQSITPHKGTLHLMSFSVVLERLTFRPFLRGGWQQTARRAWLGWIFASFALLIGVMAAIAAINWLNRNTELLAAQLESSDGTHLRIQPPASTSPAPTKNFVSDLPQTTGVHELLLSLSSLARSAGVTIVSVEVQGNVPAREQLLRAELAVTAKGSYGAVKHWLSQSLDRHANLTVQKLVLRRAGPDTGVQTDIEAAAVFSVWGAANVADLTVAAPAGSLTVGR
jgi:hypothetical protein